MTKDEETFLEQILATPDDDTVRMVYADWLDEGDDALDHLRAKLIRLQVRDGGTPVDVKELIQHKVDDLFRAPSPYAAKTRIHAHHNSPCPYLIWMPAAFDWAEDAVRVSVAAPDNHPMPVYMRLERGFPWLLSCRGPGFLRIADAVLWHPKQRTMCYGCFGTGCRSIDVSPADGPPRHPWKKYVIEPPAFTTVGCQTCGGSVAARGSGSAPRPFARTALPITKVYLSSAPDYEEKTATDVMASSATGRTWGCGYSLYGSGRKSWTWATLGEPDVDPSDTETLAMCLVRAEWPWVEFEYSHQL